MELAGISWNCREIDLKMPRPGEELDLVQAGIDQKELDVIARWKGRNQRVCRYHRPELAASTEAWGRHL